MLDALAQRVSSTLHRLSLFTEVQSERRTLADVLESSSDGIFTVGLDMAVRSWNPAMAHIVGIPADDAVGHPVGAVFRPVGRGRPGRATAAPTPGGAARPEAALVRVEGAGGEERWLTCSWSPLSEGGYVVVARDETERKKIQDDKDGWIAQVSHELRTPLTPIKGFLHTLQRRDDAVHHRGPAAHLRGDAPRGATARGPRERPAPGDDDRPARPRGGAGGHRLDRP